MITVEQARKYFPPDECPSDKDLERTLMYMYRLANREWELLQEAKVKRDEST